MFQFHEQAVKSFNAKALEIRATLQPTGPLHLVPSPPTSTSHRPLKGEFKVELASLPRPFLRSLDSHGNLQSVLIFTPDQAFKLPPAGLELMMSLMVAIWSKRPVQALVSRQYLEDTFLDWLAEQLKHSDAEWVVFLQSRCERDVSDHTVAFPLQWIEIECPFTIGPVTVRFHTAAEIDSMVEQMVAKGAPRAGLRDQLQRALQGVVLAMVTTRAEESHAVNVAADDVDLAVDMLTLLSESSKSLRLRSYFGRVGNALHPKREYVTFKDSLPDVLSSSEPMEFASPMRIRRSELPVVGPLLTILSRAFRPDNELMATVASAIRQLGTAARGPSTVEKLASSLVAIEMLLLRNNTEPITRNLALRIAHLIGEDGESRRRISSTITSAYALRSRFVHHGDKAADYREVDVALSLCCQVVGRLAAEPKFRTLAEVIDDLEAKILG